MLRLSPGKGTSKRVPLKGGLHHVISTRLHIMIRRTTSSETDRRHRDRIPRPPSEGRGAMQTPPARRPRQATMYVDRWRDTLMVRLRVLYAPLGRA
jgi:hypothetical protein